MGEGRSSSWLCAVKRALVRSDCRMRDQPKVLFPFIFGSSQRRWIFRKPPNQQTVIRHNEAAYSVTMKPPCVFVRHHCAAVSIQAAFRGYLCRRALRALKGLVQLQALVRGQNVRNRAKMTLGYMQALVRVQTTVCDHRKRLSLSLSLSLNSPTNNIASCLQGRKSVDQMKSIEMDSLERRVRSASPRIPSYMAATESAKARLRSAKKKLTYGDGEILVEDRSHMCLPTSTSTSTGG